MSHKLPKPIKNNQNKFVDFGVNQNLILSILAMDLIEMNEQLKVGNCKENLEKPKSFWFTINKYCSNLFTFYSK